MKELINNIKNAISELPMGLKNLIVALIVLLIGIGLGGVNRINKTEHDELQAYTQKIQEELTNVITERDTLKAKAAEYDAYKAKMQPYEQQQAADKKAADEKAAAEAAEKKRQEEEAKAKAEAEAKAAKEKAAAEARAKSLGKTPSEFLDAYNIQVTQYGGTVAIKPQKLTDSFITAPINGFLNFNIAQSGGFATSVYINYTNTGSQQEATQFAVTFIAAAQAIDPSITYQEGMSMANDLASRSANNLGSDVSTTKNGVKYVFNSMIGSTMAAITK